MEVLGFLLAVLLGLGILLGIAFFGFVIFFIVTCFIKVTRSHKEFNRSWNGRK